MTRKLKTHFKHFVIGSLIAALGAGTYTIAAVTFTDFVTQTPISSTEMNTKLNALKNAINSGGFVTIPVYAFRPLDSSTTFYGDSTGSNPFMNITGGNLVLLAPVEIPQGATITGLSMRAWDVSATLSTSVELRKYSGSAITTQIAKVETTAAENIGYYVKSSGVLNETVNYAGDLHPYYYLVHTVTGGVATISGPGIYAARITYTFQ